MKQLFQSFTHTHQAVFNTKRMLHQFHINVTQMLNSLEHCALTDRQFQVLICYFHPIYVDNK